MVANVGSTDRNGDFVDFGGGGGRTIKPGSVAWNNQIRANALRKYGQDFLLPGNRVAGQYANFMPVVDAKKGINTAFQLPANQQWMAATRGMTGVGPPGANPGLNTAAGVQPMNPYFGGGTGFMLPGNRPMNPAGVVLPKKV